MLRVAVALLGTSAWLLALERGPFVCNSCILQTPLPDPNTRNFIEAQRPLLEVPLINIGDTYVVCNSAACVTYALTASGEFVGGPIQPIVNAGGGGGGGGNEGGGGGYGGGGGCVASCGGGTGGTGGSGTVNVGDPEKLPPKNDN